MTPQITTLHDSPAPATAATPWKAPRWVEAHPVLTALAVTGACAAIVAAAAGIGHLLEADPSPVRLLTTLALAVLTAVLLTRWQAWRAVGFNAPRQWRHLPLMLLPMIIVLWPFATGVQITVLALLVAIVREIPNSFCEEVLFRGIILGAFAGRPAWQAAVVSGTTFGAMHLLVLLFGASIVDVAPLVVITTLFGIGYAALRIRTGTLWAPLALHAGWNIAQAATDPVGAIGEGPATLILLISALIMPVYGLTLLRHRRIPA